MTQSELEAVSETLFLPLYVLAVESQRKHGIICDDEAVAITQKLNAAFAGSNKRIHRNLARGHLPKTLVTSVALRIRHFDQVVGAFLEREPGGVVVSMGCGLSTRRGRVDNGLVRWLDVDLPAVIALRRQHLPDGERFRSIGASVLDHDWMANVPHDNGARHLFMAEGLFMYLAPEAVRSLVCALARQFGGAELVAEVSNQRVVQLASGWLGRGKLRRQFGLSHDVWFRSGLTHPREMESWADGIRLLDDWNFFDEDEPRLNWMRPFARWELFGRAQYVVRYRLGTAQSSPGSPTT